MSAAVSVADPVEEQPEERTRIRPLRDGIYVRILRPKQSAGGIIFPETFRAGKSGHSARLKIDAEPDYRRAKVLSFGPLVKGLSVGDEIIVHNWADGDGSALRAGISLGEKDCYLFRHLPIDRPDHIYGVVER